MHKSRLVLLLKSLNKQEFRRLGKFLRSPFFNTKKEVLHLYDYLRKNNHYPSFDSPILTKEQVDKKLFTNDLEPYSFQVRRIRDCMSDLSLLVIEFITVLEAQEEEDFTKDKLMLKAFSKRNLYKLFEDKTNQTLGKLEAKPTIDYHYYKMIFELREAFFFHSNTPKLEKFSEQINAIMENLDLFYVLTKLKISCELRTRERILSEVYEIELLDEVVALSTDKYTSYSSLFVIYPKLLQLFSEGYDDALYQETKTIYFEQLDQIGKSEQKIILHYLINVVSHAVYKGINHIKEVFELYKAGIKDEILILNNRITPESFSNISVLGSTLGAFKWTKDFIDNYDQYLDEDIRQDTKLISLAYWHFNKKEYDQTINLINEHQLPSKIFYIRTRALLIRTYFEKYLEDQSFYQILISNADAFRKQVDRNKLISKNKKSHNKTLIKLITRITTLIQKNPAKLKTALEKIKKDILVNDDITARPWLLQKIEQLLKKL